MAWTGHSVHVAIPKARGQHNEFIAGIRSVLISDNRARLYSGADIVEGFEVQKELG